MEDFYWLLDIFWNKTYDKFVEASERANSEEKDKVEDSATSQSDEAKDVEKEKESATSPRYIEI